MTLALRDLEGRPDDEIADALGCDEAHGARRSWRARACACAASSSCRRPSSPAMRACPSSRPTATARCRRRRAPLSNPRRRVRALPRRPLRAARGAAALSLPAHPDSSGRVRHSHGRGARRRRPGLAAPRPRRRRAAGTGGRQTAAAIAMAALVVVGAAVTIAAWQSEPSGGESSHLPAPADVPGTHATASAGRARSPRWPPAGDRRPPALVAPRPAPPAHGPRRPRGRPGRRRRRGHRDSSPAPRAPAASRRQAPRRCSRRLRPRSDPAAGGSSRPARPAAESSGGPQPVPKPDPAQPGQSTST